MPREATPHIAVIGAGIAGLACAQRLRGDGARVRVFDKGRRPGGRCATRRRPPYAFDHGAQYFTVRDPHFAAEVERWRAAGRVAPWKGRIRTLARGHVGEPPRDSARYVGTPGMSALAQALAEGLDVACSAPIAHARREGSGWTLETANGETAHGFDGLVAAVPAPQAASLFAEASALAERLRSVVMTPCQALMLVLSERLDPGFDAAFVSDSPLAWVARDASKPQRPGGECWTLHAAEAWSAARLDAAPEPLAAEMLAAFADALGRGLPPVRLTETKRWRYARVPEPLGTPFAWDADTRAGACGDWCVGGRIEGAFRSGVALAEAVRSGL